MTFIQLDIASRDEEFAITVRRRHGQAAALHQGDIA